MPDLTCILDKGQVIKTSFGSCIPCYIVNYIQGLTARLVYWLQRIKKKIINRFSSYPPLDLAGHDTLGLYKIIIHYQTPNNITKICLCNFDPLKSHFYIVKLGFIGVYIIFLISARKHRLWVLVRTASPRRF